MLQCLPMEKFPRWKKALKANKPLMISDLDGLAKSYPDEAAFFREYGVTTLLAAPFSKRINQGFIAVDDPTRYTDDPVFLFTLPMQWCWSSTKSNNSNQFGQLQKPPNIIRRMSNQFLWRYGDHQPQGNTDWRGYQSGPVLLLLAYLILNHKKKFSIDTLAEIICPYDELDSPYKVVNNIVYRLRRTLSVIGLEKLIIGKNGTFQIGPDFNIHTDFDRFKVPAFSLKQKKNQICVIPSTTVRLIFIRDSYSQDSNMSCG